jgi:2-polyprenyl-3-methyl-5-hydroxy-6-metoxy-1,4-benzoquinol methylase
MVWDLKLIKRPSRLLKSLLRPGMRILDVGASDRRMEKRIKSVCLDILYKSMDIDRSVLHDYYSLAEIDEQFDLIIFFEVIEHLELEEGVEMLEKLYGMLVDGGKLIISTPNIFHPNRFWTTATHKTAYSYEELGGIVLSQGFEVLGIYRTFHASLLKYFLRLTLFYPLHRILNVDFAKSIVVLAQRKGSL